MRLLTKIVVARLIPAAYAMPVLADEMMMMSDPMTSQ